MIDVLISVSSARSAALAAAGGPIPPPMKARALIDTGASHTCVDPVVVSNLSLSATGVIPMITPSTGSTPINCNQYDVQVSLVHADHTLVLDAVPVTESQLQQAQGFEMLLGRDILSKCVLVYHGDINLYSLSF
mgnify:CR=1 FL=1